MGGIYARNVAASSSSNVRYADFERLVVAFLAIGLGMLATKIVLILYRWKMNKSIYPSDSTADERQDADREEAEVEEQRGDDESDPDA
jgi:hypothetical protein